MTHTQNHLLGIVLATAMALVVASLATPAYAERAQQSGAAKMTTRAAANQSAPRPNKQGRVRSSFRGSRQSAARVRHANVVAAKQRTRQATKSSRSSGFRRWLTRNFRLRSDVRNRATDARALARDGDVAGAAMTITSGRSRASMGLRERFHTWRAERMVRKTAFRMTKVRSRAGDAIGTRDALDGLTVLKEANRLGTYHRWRAARARGKAFKRAASIGAKAARHGDLGRAMENYDLARDLRGAEHRRVAKSARKIYEGSFKTAKRFAKAGDTQGAWDSLQYAAAIADRANLPFQQERADKLMNRAFTKAVPLLVKTAKFHYKSGAHDQAAAALFEAIEIQREMGVRPGMITRHRQRRLTQKLLPRMRELAAQRQAAEQAAQQPIAGGQGAGY